MKGIVWVASFPKSGNTWFRAFLTNLRSESDRPADINQLDHYNFAARRIFDAALGWETSDLSPESINRLRLPVQEVLAREEDGFFKVHEAFVHPETGEPLFAMGATRAALYFIRNPLDVAISYSQHIGQDIDAAIKRMNDRMAHLAAKTTEIHAQLLQPLGDWSSHVRSWVDAPGLRVQVLRYEDMLAKPHETFTAACRFAGLPDDPSRVAKALEYSSFKELQRQEKAKGFREATASERQFFRHGRAGIWREVLSAAQIDSIVRAHGEVMRRFGYLNLDGSLPNP